MSIIKNNKTYGIETKKMPVNNQNKTITVNGEYTADQGYDGLGTVTVNVQQPTVPYLTGTYMGTPSNSFKILNSTSNISGWRIKGNTTWETPATTITVTNYGILEIEFNLTDNTTIQNSQFGSLTNLYKIELPSTVTTIGGSAFSHSNLINYPDLKYVTNTNGTNIFFACPIDIVDYTISDNVTRSYNDLTFNGFDIAKIKNKLYVNGTVYYALQGVPNGADIDYTNGIDGLPITKWSMYGGHLHYNLNSLKFPTTLQSILASSFKNCTINDLYFYGTTPPTCSPFENSGWTIWTDANITNIYVPASAVSAYQNSSAFADVVSKITAMP